MWLWITKISILSLLLIFLLHYLYSLFLQNLTTPKIKDLVNNPHEQYQDIINSIKSSPLKPKQTINSIPEKDSNKMKSELKQFLNNELNKSTAISFENNNNNLKFTNYQS